MASRAHVDHNYSFNTASSRPRRQVWFNDEEVVLPRSKSAGGSGALLASALLASAVIAGGAYAVYFAAPPPLGETPAMPLSRSWQPDPAVAQANVVTALRDSSLATPSNSAGAAEAASPSEAPIPAPTARESEEYFIDDSLPSSQAPLPESTPELPTTTPQAPYPNPTTTPPEGIAPPNTAPETPTPALNPDNPY